MSDKPQDDHDLRPAGLAPSLRESLDGPIPMHRPLLDTAEFLVQAAEAGKAIDSINASLDSANLGRPIDSRARIDGPGTVKELEASIAYHELTLRDAERAMLAMRERWELATTAQDHAAMEDLGDESDTLEFRVEKSKAILAELRALRQELGVTGSAS
jgi:hypothetical protein